MNPAPPPSPPPADGPARGTLETGSALDRWHVLGRLAAGLSGDLRTSLKAIDRQLELGEAYLPEGHPGRAPLAQVRETARRVYGLSRRIHRLSHLRPTAMAGEDLNLVALVEETLPLIRLVLPQPRSLQARWAVAHAPVHTETNAFVHLLLQATLALLRDPCPDTGTLAVSVTAVAPEALPAGGAAPAAARYYCVSLVDTADLAPPEVLPSPTPFFFTRDTRPQRLAPPLQGFTVYSTAPDGRASAHLYLPEATPPAHAPAPATAAPTAPGRVLIIDDEETVARLARQALDCSGYQTHALGSPRECLALLAQHPTAFDLILTDQRMPTMSGVQLALALRAAGNTTPVLLTSGSIAAVTADDLVAATPARFIAKPYTLNELLVAVQEAIALGRPATA